MNRLRIVLVAAGVAAMLIAFAIIWGPRRSPRVSGDGVDRPLSEEDAAPVEISVKPPGMNVSIHGPAASATSCTPALCGSYLPSGTPEPSCKCFGGALGCCRYPTGCVCERECAQFGDCCPGSESACDRPAVRSAQIDATATDILTVRGNNLGGTWFQVKVGGKDCAVLEARSEWIRCRLSGAIASTDQVVVLVDGISSPPVALAASRR